MKRVATRPWNLNINVDYQPRVSIIVPTYNEASLIEYKIRNLSKLDYPKDLIQIIVVDSKSDDGTLFVLNNYIECHPDINIKVLVDIERKGKSSALNLALKYCTNEVVIVSDADCFWPSDILHKALPYLTDSNVGAITGEKIILNEQDSWITKSEGIYLRKMNLVKLGESKYNTTLLFEGGFSAYKKEFLDFFDPYSTGSDDCGTIIRMCEKGLRSLLIPEAYFFTTFPKTIKGKLTIKLRRTRQLMQVFIKYSSLIISGRIKVAKEIIIKNIYTYFLTPLVLMFLFFITINLIINFPYFALGFFIMVVPSVFLSVFEIAQSCIMFIIGVPSVLLNKSILFWRKPEDRSLLSKELLIKFDLI